jgi:hypothetical protein
LRGNLVDGPVNAAASAFILQAMGKPAMRQGAEKRGYPKSSVGPGPHGAIAADMTAQSTVSDFACGLIV